MPFKKIHSADKFDEMLDFWLGKIEKKRRIINVFMERIGYEYICYIFYDGESLDG